MSTPFQVKVSKSIPISSSKDHSVFALRTLLTGVLFHSNFADQMQMVMFLKNLAITGAFLILAINGAGPYSLDARKAK